MSKNFKEVIQQYKSIMVVYVVSLGILLLGFVLFRFVFFGLHGMKEWPVILLVTGVIVLLLSLLTRRKYVPWFTAGGYLFGFFGGIIFHKEGLDPGGGRTDNLWQIWTITFVFCIVAGGITEVVMKWRKLLKK